MARRSRGEGNIYRRSPRVWEGSIQIDGVRRRVSGRNRAEVVAKLDALKAEARAAGGRFPDDGGRTVGDLLQEWLAANGPRWKPRTRSDNARIVATDLAPLHRIRLRRLGAQQIQRLVNDLVAQGKVRTAQLALARLKQALGMAVAWGWLASNPADRVVKPQHRAARREPWTEAELAIFLRGNDDALWRLLLGTGLRIGEALALVWDDVNLEDGTLRVERTGQFVNGEWTVTAPKTAAGFRTLTLTPDLVACLRNHRARQAEARLKAGAAWHDRGLIFTNRTGGPLHAGTLSRALRRECERLGITPVTPHTLRHWHASALLHEGVALPDVARRLGHASTQVTASIYAHSLAADDRAAAAAIERAMAVG